MKENDMPVQHTCVICSAADCSLGNQTDYYIPSIYRECNMPYLCLHSTSSFEKAKGHEEMFTRLPLRRLVNISLRHRTDCRRAR